MYEDLNVCANARNSEVYAQNAQNKVYAQSAQKFKG